MSLFVVAAMRRDCLSLLLAALVQAGCTATTTASSYSKPGGSNSSGTNSGGSANSGGVNPDGTNPGGTTNPPTPSSCAAMSSGQGASLNGFVPFPADNAWNQDISAAPVDPNSAAIISFIVGSAVALQFQSDFVGIASSWAACEPIFGAFATWRSSSGRRVFPPLAQARKRSI